MHPQITILGFKIASYEFFAGLGILAVCMLLVFRMDRIDISFMKLFGLVLLSMILILICSRLMYVIGSIPEDGLSFRSVKYNLLHGGIVFYGGMLGVLLSCVIYAHISHRKKRDMLNFAAPAIPLFHAFARIGCAFTGCCYGIRFSWGISNHRLPGETLFPVQIIEVVCNVLIFVGILMAEKKKGTKCHSIEIYLFCYGICRFILEFFRGDAIRGIWPDGLSTSQHISLVLVVAVVTEFIVIKNGHRPVHD